MTVSKEVSLAINHLCDLGYDSKCDCLWVLLEHQ